MMLQGEGVPPMTVRWTGAAADVMLMEEGAREVMSKEPGGAGMMLRETWVCLTHVTVELVE